MPIYDIICADCRYKGELLIIAQTDRLVCPQCKGQNVSKLISATSSLTGRAAQHIPGPSDTGCCGQQPGHAGCDGPGSCCGKRD